MTNRQEAWAVYGGAAGSMVAFYVLEMAAFVLVPLFWLIVFGAAAMYGARTKSKIPNRKV